jgi:ribosomal protein S6
MPEQDQKKYELVSILPPQLEGSDLENAKKEIEQLITGLEGTINFKEAKKHDLAYPINKQGQGIYLISQISIAPEKIPNLSNELKLNKQVLRHLISRMAVVKPAVKKEKRKKPALKPKAKEASKTSLEEIDKKLNEIIEEI